MATRSTKKQPTPHPEAALPFEEALRSLESLVQNMESEQVTLDDLIKNYEEGIALYRVCQSRIDEAQGRVEKIRKKRDGSIVLEELEELGGSGERLEVPERELDRSDIGVKNSSSKASTATAGEPFSKHGELF